jgi:MerR family transcriptional regulator/heat shock protein HspR
VTDVRQELSIRLTRSAAAQTVGISVTRLVRCERLGLVSPPRVNQRPVYGAAELARLRKVRRLTDDLGVNLAGTEIILRLLDRLRDHNASHI